MARVTPLCPSAILQAARRTAGKPFRQPVSSLSFSPFVFSFYFERSALISSLYAQQMLRKLLRLYGGRSYKYSVNVARSMLTLPDAKMRLFIGHVRIFANVQNIPPMFETFTAEISLCYRVVFSCKFDPLSRCSRIFLARRTFSTMCLPITDGIPL